MNVRKALSQYSFLVLLVGVNWARAVWEFALFHDLHMFLFECLGLPIILAALTLLMQWVFRKADRNNTFAIAVVLFGMWSWSYILWTWNLKGLAVVLALLGAPFAFAFLVTLIAPDNEERRLARRARIENLLVDRDAFEKSWERRIQVGEGMLVLIFASLAALGWMTSFRTLSIVPALLGAFFLYGIFHVPTRMADEKYERELVKAKARFERTNARRALYAARRAERALRREERIKQQKTTSRAAQSFSSFFGCSLMFCFLYFQDRPQLDAPDLVFLAIPAWPLIQAIYYSIRPTKPPAGPGAPSASGPPTSGLDAERTP